MPFFICFFCSLLIAQHAWGQIHASDFLFKDTYSIRGSLTDIAVLNLNEDYLPDMAVINFTNDNVTFFYNIGGCPNSFTLKESISSGDGPVAMAVADFNNNGREDFAVLNALSGTVSLYENYQRDDSSWSIRIAGTFAVSDSPQTMLVKDIDGDGKTDLITQHGNNGKVNILRNISSPGTINFEAAIILNAGINLTALCIDDLDGDDKADLLLGGTSEGGHLLILKNQSRAGTISFLPVVDQLIDLSTTALKIADLDGDGRKDLVLCGLSDHRLLLLHNECSTGLLNDTSLSTPLYIYNTVNTGDLEIADLNNDGKPELVTLIPSIDSLTIWTNTSQGEWNESLFLSQVKLPAGDDPIALTIADINLDGKKELINTNHDFRNLSVLYQKNNSCGDAAFIPSAATSYERYNEGDFVLTAFGSGLLNWYADSMLYDWVGAGIQYRTPWLVQTDTFYVSNSVSCCESKAIQVIASIRCNIKPPVAVSAYRCGVGPIELKALSNDKIYWYRHLQKDTTTIALGPLFSIPNLTTSDTFYVSAFKDGCRSLRVPVVATFFPSLQEKEVAAETGICSSSGIALSLPNSQKGMRYYVLENQTAHLYSGNGTVLLLGNYPVGTLLEVTVANACDSLVLPLVYHDSQVPVIPNLITANDDGLNDYFFILHLPDSSKLNIYNSWGTKIYEAEKYDNNWGAVVQSGIYFYELQFELCKKMESHTGWIHVTKE